ASNRCAVCKILKETCAQGCISAPYFPSNDTSFEDVSNVFGAMNIRKILVDLNTPEQPADAQMIMGKIFWKGEDQKMDGGHGPGADGASTSAGQGYSGDTSIT
ncbi:unnamed protein product, partial [Arabidopsis halleri]